jgi:hypothetical protein
MSGYHKGNVPGPDSLDGAEASGRSSPVAKGVEDR